ncbi:MAG TPA: hypothetical protein VN578_10530 [Candidatus Binatia bacterium]|jgi:hypothetical protein|nr:hypothetical protein [Candidatus Binatia bacterium]
MMSQKPFENDSRPPAPKAAAKQSAKSYPVESQDLDRQQERLKKAASAGAAAPPAKPLPVAAATPPKPATPPTPKQVVPQAAPKPPQSPVAQQQPSITATTAPKAPAVSATLAAAPSPKPVSQPTAPITPQKPVVAAKAPAPATPSTANVRFALVQPQAKLVSVCGDFNGWSPEAALMSRKEGGRWETALPLPAGRYQYKFFVDGHWLHDPNARQNVPNVHGSLNSVIEVRL